MSQEILIGSDLTPMMTGWEKNGIESTIHNKGVVGMNDRTIIEFVMS